MWIEAWIICCCFKFSCFFSPHLYSSRYRYPRRINIQQNSLSTVCVCLCARACADFSRGLWIANTETPTASQCTLLTPFFFSFGKLKVEKLGCFFSYQLHKTGHQSLKRTAVLEVRLETYARRPSACDMLLLVSESEISAQESSAVGAIDGRALPETTAYCMDVLGGYGLAWNPVWSLMAGYNLLQGNLPKFKVVRHCEMFVSVIWFLFSEETGSSVISSVAMHTSTCIRELSKK